MIYEEVRMIVELGDGLNGFPKVAHGGFVATMLDEVMGVLITTNMYARAERKRKLGWERDDALGAFTACEWCRLTSGLDRYAWSY
jgi:thioesterase superfamily protein 4